MGPPANALILATLAAARPVTDVASCRAHVLRNLAAAGNVEDGQWATLVCAPEHVDPVLRALDIEASRAGAARSSRTSAWASCAVTKGK